MPTLNQTLTRTARSLGNLLEQVFTDLGTIADATATIVAISPLASQLEQLKPLVHEILIKQAGLVDGAGVATAPGLLRDEETWLQWWRMHGDVIVFTPHNLNQASLNYYDYTEMTWFQQPAGSGKPAITAPYIDFGGTDIKVITAAVPMENPERGRSVVGADLSMDYLERHFLRNLGDRPERIALITASGKIIAANDARMMAGSRVDESNHPDATFPVTSLVLTESPWRIAAWGR